MEATKARTPARSANSLGMFDLLKGLGMVAVVFTHTAESYPLGVGAAAGVTPATFLLFAYRETLMAAFYIASGYGFRKRSIGKCIEQQCKSLLKPYIYTAVATSILHLIAHYTAFGSWESSVSETLKVAGGFALGLPHTVNYFGMTFFSCGPMWYLLALMIGWIVLDVIVNIFPEQYISWAVLGTMLLGWGITLAWNTPFCIAQGLVIVPYLYVGHLAKRHRLFEQPLPKKLVAVILGAAVLTAVAVAVTGTTDCVSLAEWTMGPVSIIADTLTGLGILNAFLWLRRHLDGPVTHALEVVGRRSLFIFCVHTVELTALPWYLMAGHFATKPTLGLILQFVISLASTLLICELLVRRRDWKLKLRARQREEEPRRRAARH